MNFCFSVFLKLESYIVLNIFSKAFDSIFYGSFCILHFLCSYVILASRLVFFKRVLLTKIRFEAKDVKKRFGVLWSACKFSFNGLPYTVMIFYSKVNFSQITHISHSVEIFFFYNRYTSCTQTNTPFFF